MVYDATTSRRYPSGDNDGGCLGLQLYQSDAFIIVGDLIPNIVSFFLNAILFCFAVISTKIGTNEKARSLAPLNYFAINGCSYVRMLVFSRAR